MIKALIFDIDGTLADTERDGHRVAFNRAFADKGLDWNWSVELYGKLLDVTGGKERIQFFVDEYCSESESPANLEELIAELHAAKTEHYKQLVVEGAIPLRPGVKRLLLEAREKGVRLAIATTSAPANVIALLETALGSDSPNWFEVIAAGDIVPTKKPAPDVYHYVLETMELAPEDCLAIEDSHHGLTAALEAELPTVVTVNDYTRNQDFSGALVVLDHLGEPDLPFEVIAGGDLPSTYLDLKLAQHVHGRSRLV